MDGPLMQIGGFPKDALPEVAETVIKVATCSAVPEVALKALDVLAKFGETSNVTISNCTLSAGGREPHPGDPVPDAPNGPKSVPLLSQLFGNDDDLNEGLEED